MPAQPDTAAPAVLRAALEQGHPRDCVHVAALAAPRLRRHHQRCGKKEAQGHRRQWGGWRVAKEVCNARVAEACP